MTRVVKPTDTGGCHFRPSQRRIPCDKGATAHATGYGIPYEYSNNLNDMNLPPRHFKADDAKVKLLVLPAVGPARPKRRCKANEGTEVRARVIIPMESGHPRPAKFKRSGQPFQIWTAPSKHLQESPEGKPTILPLFQELTRVYTRVTAALSTAPFPPSP